MFLHKITNKEFLNRKEAKVFFGLSEYRKRLKSDEFIFIHNVAIYDEEVQCKSNRSC